MTLFGICRVETWVEYRSCDGFTVRLFDICRFETWVEYRYLRWFYNETTSPENLDMKVVSSAYTLESSGSTSQETIEIPDPALGKINLFLIPQCAYFAKKINTFIKVRSVSFPIGFSLS